MAASYLHEIQYISNGGGDIADVASSPFSYMIEGKAGLNREIPDGSDDPVVIAAF